MLLKNIQITRHREIINKINDPRQLFGLAQNFSEGSPEIRRKFGSVPLMSDISSETFKVFPTVSYIEVGLGFVEMLCGGTDRTELAEEVSTSEKYLDIIVCRGKTRWPWTITSSQCDCRFVRVRLLP